MDDFAAGSREPELPPVISSEQSPPLPPHLRIVLNPFLKPTTQTAPKRPDRLSGYRSHLHDGTMLPRDDWE